ncbi:50S ribosomal protein L1 [Candidatus Gracilibacteria bacterium 28_42_T64]|nr:50S ribosomal protein L1 [Candidatus Gracilibacteria bacterium 28_42_T64]
MARGKKYNKAVELVNSEMAYSVAEAVELLEKTNTVKFDPTVEIHLNLNLDPKHADQMVRSTISLPNGSGKVSKICAFTDGNAKELTDAGATVAGSEELIDDIANGNVALDFDVCIASPSMMRHLGKIARILGPKGLMPNPKAGTVGPDLLAITKEIAAGKFEFKNDKQGNVHTIFGKLSFGTEKLIQNLEFFLKLMEDIKPAGSKGKYINSVFICNAMGPSIKLDMSTEEK